MKERQATLHQPGEELPLTLGDGWWFASSHLEQHSEGPHVLVVCWERDGGRLPKWAAPEWAA